MTSVPTMVSFNLRKIVFFYTEQRIDLRMSFYVKHNRCELMRVWMGGSGIHYSLKI